MSMNNYFFQTNNTTIRYNPYAKPSKDKTKPPSKQKKTQQSKLYQDQVLRNEYTIITPCTKENGCTCIMFNNPNGLTTQNQEKITEITTFMHQHNTYIY